jgi:FLVCR family feline leukemia virus subgroup C receptor-related protein
VINYLSQSFMLAFIPVNFPSVAVLDSYGLRAGVGVGMALTTIGLWLRCLMGESFTYAIVGQTVMAIGQPFLYNAPTKISSEWFPEGERIRATAIGAYANIFGVALGCFVPALFFSDDDLFKPEAAKEHCFAMNLVLSIASTVIFIPSVLIISNGPIKSADISPEAKVPLAKSM